MCPWGQIELVDARVAASEKAKALVDKLKADETLEADQIGWLCEFLRS